MEKYSEKTILELRDSLDKGEVTKEELYKDAFDLANKYQTPYNPFVTIIDTYKETRRESILSGIPYALKDNFSTRGILTTGSSNIMKDYIPPYDATVYKKLKEAGATLVGKTVLDELAMGGTGTTGHTGVVRNPWDKERLIGGSSAGSAAAVALGIVPFAIGSDTGDSVRKPAAYGGIVGYKPTYGLISRYGLFAFASSLDHVAYFARCVKDAAIITDTLKGKDILDMTTFDSSNMDVLTNIDSDIKGKKLFYFKDVLNKEFYKDNSTEILDETLDKFHETIEKIRSIGVTVDEVEFPTYLLESLYPTYMSISCAEATSNNANLTGIQFGPRGEGENINEIMFNARTKGFSELIKRRFVLGSYILQKENQEKLFINAKRIRRLVVDKMNEIFEKYDGLIMPASGGIAPKFGEASDALSDSYLILENHLVIGNFGGYPSITIPSGFVKDMPIAINITGKVMDDANVLNIANKIEEILPCKGQIAKGDK